MTDNFEPRHPDRLIIPLDGSRAADLVVPFTALLAQRANLPITVLHVFDDVGDLSSLAVGEIDWSEDAEPRAVIRPPASIRDAVALLTEHSLDVEVIGRVGKADEEILSELEKQPGAWIAMTTLGMSGFRSLFLGSTARNVIWASDRPVLLVPASEENASLAAEATPLRVAVFLDGSSLAERGVPKAVAVSNMLATELDLVRVGETFQDDPEAHSSDDRRREESARRHVETYLYKIAESCHAFTEQINIVPLAGSPEVQLRRYVQEADPTLVVLSTRRRSGIDLWTYGSLAERIANESHAPLLLVPVDET